MGLGTWNFESAFENMSTFAGFLICQTLGCNNKSNGLVLTGFQQLYWPCHLHRLLHLLHWNGSQHQCHAAADNVPDFWVFGKYWVCKWSPLCPLLTSVGSSWLDWFRRSKIVLVHLLRWREAASTEVRQGWGYQVLMLLISAQGASSNRYRSQFRNWIGTPSELVIIIYRNTNWFTFQELHANRSSAA